MFARSSYSPFLDNGICVLLFFYVCVFPFSIAAGNFCIDAALILAGIRIFFSRQNLHWDRKIILFICLYGFMMLLSALRSVPLQLGLRQAFNAIYYLLPPFALAHLFILPRQRFYYLYLMLLSVLISASYAYVQSLQGYVRAFGFIAPLELAGSISQLLPITVLLVCEQSTYKSNFLVRALSMLTFFVFAAGLILMGPRGAWLAVGFTLSLYFAYLLVTARKSFFIVALFLLLTVFALAGLSFIPAAQKRMESLANPNDYSIVTRFAMWSSATKMWVDHPLVGVGLGNYPEFYRTRYYDPEPWERFRKNHDGLTHKHPHNIFLHLLAETGIVGLLSFALLLGHAFRHFIALWRTGSPNSQIFAKIALSLLIIYLTFGLTENLVFGMFPAMQSLWFLLGMLWNPANHTFKGA